jgi:hypothetical protein
MRAIRSWRATDPKPVKPLEQQPWQLELELLATKVQHLSLRWGRPPDAFALERAEIAAALRKIARGGA